MVKIKTIFFGHPIEGASYPTVSFQAFIDFFSSLPCFQLDVETTPEDDFPKRILRTIQFGYQQSTDYGSVIHRVVIQVSWLNKEQWAQLKQLLENPNQPKLIHNATFEYEMMRKVGIILSNVIDTMNYEKIILSGKSGQGMYALDDLAMKYLCMKMDKSYQKAFAEDILTAGHIEYAAQDVSWLQAIARMQKDSIDLLGSALVAGLENGCVLAVGEMQYNGMGMDINYWLQMSAGNEPLRDQAEQEINKHLFEEPFYKHCLKEKHLIEEDTVIINWNAPAQRAMVLKYLYPDLQGATKPVVTKYNKEKDDPYLRLYLQQDFADINEMLLVAHRDWLLENGFLHEAGTVLLNWNSPAQVLKLFQTVSPKLKSVEEESLLKVRHPVVKTYLKFKETEKLISTYGAGFVDKHLHSDGKVRPRYNQIVSTGRFSSSGPNIQNIPKDNKYRNGFIPPDGFKVVSSDFSSQELCVLAYMTKEKVFLDALIKGEDLHSICADLVFGYQWRQAADEDCAYFKSKQKCNCKAHKKLRDQVKSISFGLVYGMSSMKLSRDLEISLPEADKLMMRYFKTFPAIGRVLDYLGNFGVTKGYIQTIAPFFRKRVFEEWEKCKLHIDEHVMGIQYHSILGGIERQSKNCPIQGSSADMVKVALWMIWTYIKENNLWDEIHLVAQVHDEICCFAVDDKAEWWGKELSRIMEEAALFIIPNGLLKTDTTITDRWQK